VSDLLEQKHWSKSTGAKALEQKHWSKSTGAKALEQKHWSKDLYICRARE
jgi:hypothetical protein